MKTIIFSAIALFVNVLYAQRVQQPQIKNIDILISKLIDSNQSLGFMFGIKQPGEKAILKNYGRVETSSKKLVDEHTEFRIASITKPITAVAVMTLIEKGQLKLTDTISTFFKNFPKGNKITIYQLLSHTSGIPNWWEGGMPSNEPKDFPMCKQPHLYLEKMQNTSFFEPGTKFAYSNSGYVLLGEIIEMVSGMSYENYLKKYIFSKANMLHTEVEYTNSAKEQWAKGSVKNNPKDSVFSDPAIYAMPFAAGALRSNTSDLIKFIEALYGGKLVKKSTLSLMTGYAKTNKGVPVYDAVFFPNNVTPPSPRPNIKKYGYGLGFNLMDSYNVPFVWHSGGIAGFNSILVYIPFSKSTFVFLSNTENGIMPIWEDLQKEMIQFKLVK